MQLPLRSLYAASLGLGIIAGLAGCSVSSAPAPAQPVIVQTPPPAQSNTVVQPGSTVIVPPRY